MLPAFSIINHLACPAIGTAHDLPAAVVIFTMTTPSDIDAGSVNVWRPMPENEQSLFPESAKMSMRNAAADKAIIIRFSAAVITSPSAALGAPGLDAIAKAALMVNALSEKSKSFRPA